MTDYHGVIMDCSNKKKHGIVMKMIKNKSVTEYELEVDKSIQKQLDQWIFNSSFDGSNKLL